MKWSSRPTKNTISPKYQMLASAILTETETSWTISRMLRKVPLELEMPRLRL